MKATDKQVQFAESLKADFVAKIARFIDEDATPGAAESFIEKLIVNADNAVNWIEEKGVYLQSEFCCDIAMFGEASELWAHWTIKRPAVHGRKLLTFLA